MSSFRRTMIRTAGAFALGMGTLAAALPAQAAEAPAADVGADLAARTAAAAKLVEVMHLGNQLDAMMPQLIGLMMGTMMRGNTGHEDEVRTILTEEFNAAFSGQKAAFLDNYRDIYAKNLSLGEIKAMTDFYGSPTGQSVLSKMPKINEDGMAGGATIGRKAAQQALPRIIQRMQAVKLAVPQGV